MMTPEIQRGIFAGESGGDYDALFGYSQRPGGRFAGVKPTEMTVDEWRAFADPRGAYGQWVKSEVGHVATPVGAYQVVGSTFNDAVEALGLPGDTKMTPDVQDRVGSWILQTQGTGAWEGYKGPMTGGGGVATLAGNAGNDDMQDDDRMMRIFGRDINRDNLADTLTSLGAGFTGLSSGNFNDFHQTNARLAQNKQLRERHQDAKASRNKTVAWLRQTGRDDLAEAVATGAISGADAMRVAYQAPADSRTSMQKNFEFIKQRNPEMSDMDILQMVRGGTNVNVNTGGPKLGSLSTDYGYVRDPETGDPVIDPQTGLPTAAPVPGSKAAQEIATANQKASESDRQGGIRRGVTMENIRLNQQEIENGGLPVTGLFGVAGAAVPGTPAADFRARNDQVSAASAFAELQAMRDASPTGGAVGQLTDKEREAIAASVSNLQQATSAQEYLRASSALQNLMLDLAHGEGQWHMGDTGEIVLGAKPTGPNPYAGISPDDFSKINIMELTPEQLDQLYEAMGQ